MRVYFVRGVSLGGTLLAVFVLSMLGFALSSLCVTHLRLTGLEDRSVLAANAARSAAAAAISKVLDNKTFGEQRTADEAITVEMDQAVGLVRFREEDAAAEGILFSTNNISGTEDAPGDEDILVPSGTVMITAIGRSGDTVRRVDAALRLPPFPWAIASGGKIDTINGVLVAALPPDTWPPPTDESLLLPADLVANGSGSDSIVLGDHSKVLGDVETPGTVKKNGTNVTVKGEIRNGSATVDLPSLDPATFDPEVKGVEHFPLDDPTIEELTGVGRADQDITFSKLLTLDNGQIFVDGDLVLNRGVQGTGIVIATGDITIRGGASIEGSTELAIVSGGTLTINGAGAASARIRGLLYARDGMTARDITLVGTLLTGNATTGITLDHVNVYYEEPRVFDGTTTIASGNYNIGLVPEVDLLHPSPIREVSDWSKPTTEPLPAGNEAVLRAKIESTNGGFPVTVTFLGTPGSGTTGTGSTYSSMEDFEARFPELLTTFYPTFPLELWYGGETGVEAMGQLLLAEIKKSLEGQPLQETPPSVSLLGDLSEFLPTEDRIRVVSWIER